MESNDWIERSIERAEQRIKDNPLINQRNKRFLLEFRRQCKLDKKIGLRRHLKLLCMTNQIGELFGSLDFDKATRADIDSIIEKIQERNNNQNTLSDKKKALKKLFKVLFGQGEEYPQAVRHVKVYLGEDFQKELEKKKADNLLKPEDVDMMVKATNDLRFKAMIRFMIEVGPRWQELIGIQVKHLEFDGDGFCNIQLSGKTGTRLVSARACVPSISLLLETHPGKDNPDSPLWYSIQAEDKIKPLAYATVKKRLKSIARKAGVRKTVTTHCFRRACATRMVQCGLTEKELCDYFGWKFGSDVPRAYITDNPLASRNVIRRLYGKEKVEQTVPFPDPTVKCWACGTENARGLHLCQRCGCNIEAPDARKQEALAALEVYRHLKRVGDDPETILKAYETLKALAYDPKLNRIFDRMLREKRGGKE